MENHTSVSFRFARASIMLDVHYPYYRMLYLVAIINSTHIHCVVHYLDCRVTFKDFVKVTQENSMKQTLDLLVEDQIQPTLDLVKVRSKNSQTKQQNFVWIICPAYNTSLLNYSM